jgi:hypothetical protein
MSEFEDGSWAAAATPPVAAAPDRPRDGPREAECVHFDRAELQVILSLYGRMVAAGEWRDYAIDHLKERAVFSIFRRSGESPLYRIDKAPKLMHRQGQYSVVAQGGLILKRGADLGRVVAVLEKRPKLVAV